MKFYYGAASGSERKALRQLEEPNVMINYATQNNKPWDSIENLFIDSGGYSFMKGKGEYQTTDRKYLEFIEKHRPGLFALRDYPCEPKVLEENGRTVQDHLEATVNRHRNLLNILYEYDIRNYSIPVAVIQGWEKEDYIKHVSMMKNANILSKVNYVAIGSVCRRNEDEEIREIINEVHDRIGDKSLHAFGVKSNILRFSDMIEKLDSADSLAYSKGSRYNDQTVSGKGINNFRNIALNYLKFKKNINSTLNSDSNKQRAKNQDSLESFVK